jgi:hypothetical protein
MNRKIILLLLVLSGLYTQAQVSGYQGKRLLLSYDEFFMSALSGPNQNGNNGFASFNLHNRVSIDYVLSRGLSLGVDYHFFNTCFQLPDASIDYFDPSYGGFNTANLVTDGMLAYSSVTGIGIHLKKYFTNNIAPLGNYFEFGIIDFFQDVTYDKVKLKAQNPDVALSIPNYSPYSSGALNISYGKKSIFFNCLVLDYGMQSGIVFNGITPTIRQQEYYHDMNTYLQEPARMRLLSHFLFNIHVGVGLLVF